MFHHWNYSQHECNSISQFQKNWVIIVLLNNFCNQTFSFLKSDFTRLHFFFLCIFLLSSCPPAPLLQAVVHPHHDHHHQQVQGSHHLQAAEVLIRTLDFFIWILSSSPIFLWTTFPLMIIFIVLKYSKKLRTPACFLPRDINTWKFWQWNNW